MAKGVIPRPKHQVPRGYTPQEFEFAMQALALSAGSGNNAFKLIESMGEEHRKELGINKTPAREQLYEWRRRYRERYEELRDKALVEYRQNAADAHSRLADEHMKANWQALTLLRSKLSDMSDKDLIGAVNHTGVQSGIHRDKAAMLRGEGDTRVNVTLNVSELIRELSGGGGTKFYDQEGREISPDEAERQVIQGEAKEVEK